MGSCNKKINSNKVKNLRDVSSTETIYSSPEESEMTEIPLKKWKSMRKIFNPLKRSDCDVKLTKIGAKRKKNRNFKRNNYIISMEKLLEEDSSRNYSIWNK